LIIFIIIINVYSLHASQLYGFGIISEDMCRGTLCKGLKTVNTMLVVYRIIIIRLTCWILKNIRAEIMLMYIAFIKVSVTNASATDDVDRSASGVAYTLPRSVTSLTGHSLIKLCV
jgi:hypothetical protein